MDSGALQGAVTDAIYHVTCVETMVDSMVRIAETVESNARYFPEHVNAAEADRQEMRREMRRGGGGAEGAGATAGDADVGARLRDGGGAGDPVVDGAGARPL